MRRLVASSKRRALQRFADDAERTLPRLRRALALELRRVGHLVRVRIRVGVGARVRVRVRVRGSVSVRVRVGVRVRLRVRARVRLRVRVRPLGHQRVGEPLEPLDGAGGAHVQPHLVRVKIRVRIRVGVRVRVRARARVGVRVAAACSGWRASR